jgi:hypothetical protein
MLPSGYLIRPCEGGGSIIHIVDHMDLEVCSQLILFLIIFGYVHWLWNIVGEIIDCRLFYQLAMECTRSITPAV